MKLSQVDMDLEAPLDLEGLLSQMFELLLVIVGKPQCKAQLQPVLPDIIRVTLTYMQMTAGQASSWADDPNQYIADEEELFASLRASGEMLLDELCEVCRAQAVADLLASVQQRMQVM